MKGMKKLLSILMVLTLVLSLGATAFAATVTIDPKLAEEGHTFTAYQIFKGVQDPDYKAGAAENPDDNAPLGEIKWGNGIDKVEFVKELKGMTEFATLLADVDVDDPDAKAVAKALGEAVIAPEKIAEVAAKHLTTGTPFDGSSTTVEDGYYLIKDTTENLNGSKAYNDVVLQVTKDIEVEYKTDVPTSEKKVQDINDTEDNDVTDNSWDKSADWDIGDQVPFQFTGTLPNNYGDYKTYAITFHDEQSKGLTFDGKGTVHAYYVTADGDKTEISTDSYDVVTPTDDGCTFEVKFDDLKTIKDTKGGDITTDATGKIVVEYTSTLNADAVIGVKGNRNTMRMDFSNNAHGEGTGRTPDSTVIVFTFDYDVIKEDDEHQPLEGAGFTLYKKNLAGEWVEVNHDGAAGEQVTKVVDGKTVINFKGLDDGDYKLEETTVPPGYNKAPDVFFSIVANHVVGSWSSMEANQLKIERVSGGTVTVDTTDTDEKGNSTTKGATSTVINDQGATLPETGGIGTTIFYIAGAILVAGAVILLVTKKRVSGMEK